jgi:N-acetylated-alpha-linked acidic dipeptidase
VPKLSASIPAIALGIALAGATAAALSAGPPPAPQLLGFSAQGAERELALEQQFDAALSAADLRTWLQQFSAEPNNVGSPHDRANAEAMRQMLGSWGWDARIETFYVLYATPTRELLELVAPTRFRASLAEPPIAGDDSTARGGVLPPYNVFGADGDVTAPLVYVNRGMDDDYRELARLGIDVRGKIVITRYGGGWRGLKPKLAQEHGAIGCLIYSDPRDDGYAAGDVYPAGGWRPPDGVQRGSVADMPIYAGDPLTPGVGATKNAKRLTRAEAQTLLKIPVIPISYADARPLLEALGGPVAPEAWRGALPITYHVGAGPAEVHLAVTSDWGLKPIYDVIAKMRGSDSQEQWVVRGNHHDGWVFGAWDPLSGAVAELAEAKAIGALVKSGWRPKRTLVYASWDGEEPGLFGSTEWAEAHAEELQRKAVLYLNSDENGRGFLQAGGSHSLQRLLNEVAEGVRDPETGASVAMRWRARLMVNGYGERATEESRKAAAVAASNADLPLAALGSGSDYTPFLQHLGIASLNLGYSGEEDQQGVYHSRYDTFEHFVRFGDPTFVYGIAMAQTAGHIMLRVANAEALPLRVEAFADTVEGYRQELHKLADEQRSRAQQLTKLLDENAFGLASDPTHPLQAPPRTPEVPAINFAPLDKAVARLQMAAKQFDEAYARSATMLSAASRAELNDLLRGMEQTLTDPKGLPGRPWYKHLVYAPGVLTGYGAKTLPGVREAIEQQRWAEADQYAAVTAQALNAYCDRLERATAVLGK